MRPKWNVLSFMIALHLAVTLLLVGPVQAQQLPRSVTIATNPPGTVFYAVGSGLSKVMSEALPFQAVVQPYPGSSTFLRLWHQQRRGHGAHVQRAELQNRRAQSFPSHSQCSPGDARGAVTHQHAR